MYGTVPMTVCRDEDFDGDGLPAWIEILFKKYTLINDGVYAIVIIEL